MTSQNRLFRPRLALNSTLASARVVTAIPELVPTGGAPRLRGEPVGLRAFRI